MFIVQLNYQLNGMPIVCSNNIDFTNVDLKILPKVRHFGNARSLNRKSIWYE